MKKKAKAKRSKEVSIMWFRRKALKFLKGTEHRLDPKHSLKNRDLFEMCEAELGLEPSMSNSGRMKAILKLLPQQTWKSKGKRENTAKSFYSSWEWKEVRYKILQKYGSVCMLCGATKDDARIVVDHIKPRSKYPNLELNENNLQVLCNSCNMGKSNKDETDFRV